MENGKSVKKAYEGSKLHEVLSISIVTRSRVTVCQPKKEEAFPRKIVTTSCKLLRLTIVAVVSAPPFSIIQRSDI